MSGVRGEAVAEIVAAEAAAAVASVSGERGLSDRLGEDFSCGTV